MTAKPLLLDSNVLALLVVGATDQNYIKEHKRLGAYDREDYLLLTTIVAHATHVVFCPNVLSETSNLIRYVAEPYRTRIGAYFAVLVGQSIEQTIESRQGVSRPEYFSLGLTDAVLLELAKTGAVLLTADRQLYDAAVRAGYSALNFGYLRMAKSVRQ